MTSLKSAAGVTRLIYVIMGLLKVFQSESIFKTPIPQLRMKPVWRQAIRREQAHAMPKFNPIAFKNYFQMFIRHFL